LAWFWPRESGSKLSHSKRFALAERRSLSCVSHYYLSKSLIFARIFELGTQELKQGSFPGFLLSFFLIW